MSGEASTAAQAIEDIYERAAGEVEFTIVLAQLRPDDDDALAEAIEADGRMRMSRGRGVDFGRYLGAIDDLAERPVPLDAAIDVALRSQSGGAHVPPRVVAELVQQHPHLEKAIREAAVLNAAICSTTGLRSQIAPPPPKPLPMEFGPVLTGGERRYVLKQLLGQGAFGQVYLGLDRQMSEEGHTALVAIKILVSSERTPWDRQRLIEEATKVRRISHSNVVQVLDRGISEQNEDFIVYEYVDGGDLSDRLSDPPKPWPAREAAMLVANVARGIHAAHSAGIIHCDLKPGNIMMTAAGEPKVADFGVAIRIGDAGAKDLGDGSRAGDPDRPIGNIAFIAPEQFRGESDAITVQADIYAIGGILYFLLSGKLPNGTTLSEIASTHDKDTGRREPPRISDARPDIDRDLESICCRSLSVKPEDRYASAAALEEDLHRWLQFEPLAWNSPGRLRVVRLWAKRKPALAAALAGIFAMAVAATSIAAHFASVARQRQLDAAVAKAMFEGQQREKAEQDKKRLFIFENLTKLRENYRMNTETLPQIWYLEYLLGPKVLDIPEAQAHLWERRIETIRWFVNDARKQGRGEMMETLTWESALGFWLVGSGDYVESEPLLNDNLQRWRAKLDPSDRWIADVQAMLTCAAANRLVAEAKNGQVDRGDSSEVRRVEAALIQIDSSMPADHRGTPLHLLALDRLIDLYGPTLLNDAGKLDATKKAKTQALTGKREEIKPQLDKWQPK